MKWANWACSLQSLIHSGPGKTKKILLEGQKKEQREDWRVCLKLKKQEGWRDRNFCSGISVAEHKTLDMDHLSGVTRTGTWWLWEENVVNVLELNNPMCVVRWPWRMYKTLEPSEEIKDVLFSLSFYLCSLLYLLPKSECSETMTHCSFSLTTGRIIQGSS